MEFGLLLLLQLPPMARQAAASWQNSLRSSPRSSPTPSPRSYDRGAASSYDRQRRERDPPWNRRRSLLALRPEPDDDYDDDYDDYYDEERQLAHAGFSPPPQRPLGLTTVAAAASACRVSTAGSTAAAATPTAARSDAGCRAAASPSHSPSRPPPRSPPHLGTIHGPRRRRGSRPSRTRRRPS